jgi:hypothetical protein
MKYYIILIIAGLVLLIYGAYVTSIQLYYYLDVPGAYIYLWTGPIYLVIGFVMFVIGLRMRQKALP